MAKQEDTEKDAGQPVKRINLAAQGRGAHGAASVWLDEHFDCLGDHSSLNVPGVLHGCTVR